MADIYFYKRVITKQSFSGIVIQIVSMTLFFYNKGSLQTAAGMKNIYFQVLKADRRKSIISKQTYLP